MKLITVTGYKGGCGKSTTAIHLATYFSARGKTLLIDSDQNRTAVAWAKLGKLPFDVKDEKSSIKAIAGNDYIVVDTPARPESNDLKELASNGDLLVLPTTPDVVSLRPAILTTKDIPKGAKYRVLLTIVPPYPSKEGVTVQQDLRESGIPIFNTMIRRTSGFTKAALSGLTIRDLKDKTKMYWQDYKDLGLEIEEIINE